MKIAFDEHIPPVMVRVFQTLADEGAIQGFDFVSAKSYGIPKAPSDVPWIEKFAADGGQIIISGDKGIRSNPHEREALHNAGMITFFFSPQWNQKNSYVKSAMLLNWWPKIRETIPQSVVGQCWEIWCQWNWKPLKDVTGKKGNQNVVKMRGANG